MSILVVVPFKPILIEATQMLDVEPQFNIVGKGLGHTMKFMCHISFRGGTYSNFSSNWENSKKEVEHMVTYFCLTYWIKQG